MPELFNHITIKLSSVENNAPFNFKIQSLFFYQAYRLCAYRVVAQIPDKAKKDESLGHLWEELQPSKDGFLFEIATELPFFLPNMSKFPEYMLIVGSGQYLICNRMVRAHFLDPSSPIGEPEYYLLNRLGLSSLKQRENIKNFALCPIPMKSFISRKFRCHENTAEESIIKNYLSWQDELFSGISNILRVFRTIRPLEFNNLLPVSSPASCPILWLAAVGDGNGIACEQFAGNTGMAALRPVANLEREQSVQVRALLLSDQPVEIFEDALGLARTFFFYGYLDLAIIQLCTACEALLSEAVKEYLTSRKVSRKALKEQYRDVTYSQLLNFFLPAAIDVSKIKDYQMLLADLNWARKLRNELVHPGAPAKIITTESVQEAIQSAERLAQYLKGIPSHKNNESIVPPSIQARPPRRRPEKVPGTY